MNIKHLLLVTAALCASLTLSAQSENREVKAAAGDTYVEKQGSYTPSFKVDGSNKKIRNIILMIGDGMGVGAVNSAMYANGGELTMTNLKTVGFVRTQSADNFTTDSAASGFPDELTEIFPLGARRHHDGFLGKKRLHSLARETFGKRKYARVVLEHHSRLFV